MTVTGLHWSVVVPPCMRTNATVSPSPGIRAMSAEQSVLSSGPTDLTADQLNFAKPQQYTQEGASSNFQDDVS